VYRLLEEKNFKAAGLDIFPKMIEVAEKRLKGRAELKVGDAEALPWEDNSFNIVICNDSSHQSFVIPSIYNFSLRFKNPAGDVIIYSGIYLSPGIK
jgi:ubiquinone/menaquinone biosynthesis C-methylase UbiE